MDIPVGDMIIEWQSYVTTISRNLMELSEQTDVKLIKLKTKDTANGYTGLTKARAVKAVNALDTLWRYYAILSSVIDKARDLYSRDSFLKDTERDVRILLLNTPITLETEHIDISTRSLLTPENVATKVSLRELLKLMQESFETTRNTFNEISHASEILEERLKGIKDEIDSLCKTAQRLGIIDMPSFDFDRVAKAESDPLQGILQLDDLSRSIEGYRASVRSAEEDYNKTRDALNRAAEMLHEIEDLEVRSQSAVSESRKIFTQAYNPLPAISQDVLKSLRDWLSVLEGKLSEGRLNAAKVGAQRLELECISKLNTARENYDRNSKDYNEWLDLKGRFKALLVKREGLKMKGVPLSNSLDDLVDSIQKSLNEEKVNLYRLRQLIEVFHSSLKS